MTLISSPKLPYIQPFITKDLTEFCPVRTDLLPDHSTLTQGAVGHSSCVCRAAGGFLYTVLALGLALCLGRFCDCGPFVLCLLV